MATGNNIPLKCNKAASPSSRLTVYGSGRTPHVFRGNGITFRVAIYDPDGSIADLSDHSTLTLAYMEDDRTTAATASETVAIADSTFTEAQFAAGTHEHAAFSFTEAEMNPTISSGLSKDFWMVLYGTAGGLEITHGGTSKFTVEIDGSDNSVTPPGAPAVGITSAQAQALIDGQDGDVLDVDFTPTNYTPDATPAEASDVDDLAAHLYGIDQRLDFTDGAVLDGDVIDIDFTPTNYTPDATPAEASDVDDLAAHLEGIDTVLGTSLQADGSLAGTGKQELLAVNLTDSTELTIATGAVTATQGLHTIDTEADAASDELDTISGGAEGDILYISAADAARSVVVKHGTGNIQTWGGTDITLDETRKIIQLIYTGGGWLVVGNP